MTNSNLFLNYKKGFHFNERKELIFKTTGSSDGNESNEQKDSKKKTGFAGAMSDDDKAKEFEKFRDQIYDFDNHDIRKMSEMKEVLDNIRNRYNNPKTGNPMTQLNVWMAAKRYGMTKKYVGKNPRLDVSTDSNESFALNDLDTVPIKNPKNGIWIVDIGDELSLQSTSTKGSARKGMRAALKLEFYRVFECSCLIEFRNISAVENEMQAMAFCKECTCEIHFSTFSDRKFLRIMVDKFDMNAKHSQNKLKVTGKLKTKILKMLEADKPGIVQAKLAEEMISNFSGQHPLVPTKRTIRQIKYRENEKQRTFRDKNPVVSICKMKNEPKFYKCIEDVGISPFFVYYATPLQKAFVKSESRTNTTKISIDATGCSCQLSDEAEISERTGKKKRCFFYNMMLHGKKKTTSVYQMLSQTHSSQKITDWLLTWKNSHNNQRDPIEVRMDESAALILSSVIAFTPAKSVHEYLSHCHDHLIDKDNVARPKTYIRLDRSHVVASLHRNAVFKKVFGNRNGPKFFYLRIIGYLLQEPDLKKAESAIRNTFAIASNRFLVGIDSNLLENMHELVKTHKNDIEPTDSEQQIERLEDSNFKEEKSRFYMYIKNIADDEQARAEMHNNNIDDNDTFKMENAYYAVGVVPELVKIFSKLPMSGCLLNESFGLPPDDVPTSSQVEANFRTIAHDLFSVKKRNNIDKWLEIHLNFLIGESKAINTDETDDFSDEEVNEPIDLVIEPMSEQEVEDDESVESFSDLEVPNEPKSANCINDLQAADLQAIDLQADDMQAIDLQADDLQAINLQADDLQADNLKILDEEKYDSDKKGDSFDGKVKQEPWRGLNDAAKKARKVLAQRSKISILTPRGESSPELPFLRNGSEFKIRIKTILITHTCPFDAFFQIFLAIYKDNPKCHLFIKNTNDPNDLFVQILKLVLDGAQSKNIYQLRADFLIARYEEHCQAFDGQLMRRIHQFKAQMKLLRNGKTDHTAEERAVELHKLSEYILLEERKKIRPIYFKEETKSLVHLKCETESDTMLKMIVQNSIFYSCTKHVECTNCKTILTAPIKLPAIPMEFLIAKIDEIQSYFKPTLKVSKTMCEKCNQPGRIVLKPSRIIVIDCEQFSYRNATSLSNITQGFVYHGKKFDLKGNIFTS